MPTTLQRALLTASCLLLALAAAAQAQDTVATEPVAAPDSAVLAALPDSAAALADTTLAPLPDSVALAPKKRRLELRKVADTPATVDTSHRSRIFRYAIDHRTNEAQRVEHDTSLFYFRTDYPFFRDDVGAIFLGSLGSPAIYYDYFKRTHRSDLIFVHPYEAYFFSPDNVSFYNTTTPYSLLYYAWAGSTSKMEDQLRVLHAQNITNRLTFELAYNGMGTKGIYPRQHLDNRSFHGGLSYLGKYYKATFGYIYNEVEGQESGGIANDSLITDTVVDPQQHLARLAAAKNHLTSSTLYLTHSVDIPMWEIGNDSVITNVLMGRIGHAIEYTSASKVYTDAGDTAYYAHHYFDQLATRDSFGISRLENRLFLHIKPLRPYIFESLSGGVGYKSMQAFMFDPAMYLAGTASQHLSTLYAYAAIAGAYKLYHRWDFSARTNLSGYQRGDYQLAGGMTFSLYPSTKPLHLTLGATFAGASPDVFTERYTSNHYRWQSDFDRTTELRLEAALRIPFLHLELGFKHSTLGGLTYFAMDGDGSLRPRQHPGVASIAALSLRHDLRYAGICLDHRMLAQLSSASSALPLPLFALSATYYYEAELIKKVIYVQAGVDWQYSTTFNGYAYDPSVGMFYPSTLRQGGHLWADLFFAFRWKRATPFFKLEHASQGLIDGNSSYFSAVHYPRNERVFKMGLSWKFFD